MLLQWSNGRPFAIGRARFADSFGVEQGTPKVFIKIRLGALDFATTAQLDTGSAWSVLNAEIAGELSLLDGDGQVTKLATPGGTVVGRLERTRVAILADDGNGRSLTTEATFFVSPHWTGHTFLGYAGLLAHVRFALDPRDNFFYFDSA